MSNTYSPICRTPRHHRNYKIATRVIDEMTDNGYKTGNTYRLTRTPNDRDDIFIKY